MTCPNCGKENNFGTVFCIECGAQMPDSPAGNQPTYEPAPTPPPASSSVLGLGEFTLMEFIARIPLVNIILFFIWGFGSDTNENKRNWARSRLIWVGIGFVLSIISALIGASIIGAFAASFSDVFESLM